MDIKIQAVRFEASEKLEDFIVKKVSKLSKFSEEVGNVEVTLKVVKPETAVTNPVFNGVTVVNTTGIADSDDRGYTKYKEKQKNR